MTKVILAIITVLLLGCTKNTNQPQHAPVKSTDIYRLADADKKNTPAHYNQSNSSHTLIAYKQSNCKATTVSIEKILHKALRSDTLVVKVRGTKNCDTQYKGDFRFTDNHLNLSLTRLPKIVKRKNGQTDTIYTTQECDCVYEFTYTINHIRAMPQTISLNGKVIN